jgi:predicted nucleic acid-binding protein
MNEVFADSVYYIALFNSRDQFHDSAVRFTVPRRIRVVTTHWVLMEVADALCAPVIRPTAARFVRRALADRDLILISELSPWFEVGLRLYETRPDKSWFLTDCISFAVMEARGIREALTGDHHFAQAGFTPLLLPAAGSA